MYHLLTATPSIEKSKIMQESHALQAAGGLVIVITGERVQMLTNGPNLFFLHLSYVPFDAAFSH
eukprot:c35790_g1_i1 orf=107-298(+)